MKRVFNFAMPFLQASLVKQILVGLVLGIALAYAAPASRQLRLPRHRLCDGS